MLSRQIIKTFPLGSLLLAACPLLILASVVFWVLGGIAQSQALTEIAANLFIAVFPILLPLGIGSAVQSWRMSRSPLPACDLHDFIEFLLGFQAFVMITYGSLVIV